MALQNLRSNTANKRPTASGMVDGQVAINTNATNPGLFFKDAGDGIRKVGPVFIGSSAPNSSPAVGGSTGHSIGEQWLDTSGSRYVVKTWDGTAWRDDDSNYLQLTGGALSGALTIDNAANIAALDLKFDGDTDTGFYAPAANTLGFVGGGTERLRIDSSGKFGFGTSTVSTAKFTFNSGGTNEVARFESTDPGAYLSFKDSTSSSINFIEGGADQLSFGTNNAERLRIDSSGNVGIGTSSPVANTPLTLQGPSGYTDTLWLKSTGTNIDSRINFGPTGTGNAQINNATGTDIAFQVSGSEKLRIDSFGRVGIGTTSPENNLHIADTLGPTIRLTNSTGSDGSYIGRILTGDAAGSFFAGINFIKHDTNDGEIRFRTKVDGTNQDTVTIVDGRVGIGTSSPASKAHIKGGSLTVEHNSPSTGTGQFNINSESNSQVSLSYDDQGHISIGTASAPAGQTGFSEKVRIDSSGRFMLGTTTEGEGDADNLTIADTGNCGITLRSGTSSKSSIHFSDATSGTGEYDGFIVYNQNDRNFKIGTTANTRLTIDSSGNVGIGTSSPAGILELSSSSTPQLFISNTSDSINSGDAIATLDFRGGSSNTVLSRMAAVADSTAENGAHIVFENRTGGGSFSEKLRIDSSGNVGIGTTSPGAKLELRDNTQALLSWGDTAAIGSLSFDGSSQPVVRALSGKSLVFQTNGGNERMRIDSSGNVGIGTSSPGSKVHVFDSNPEVRLQSSGTSTTCEYSMLGRDGSNVAHKVNIKTSDSALTFGTGGSSGNSYVPSERMRLDSSGNLGIGATSLSNKLEVNGNQVLLANGQLKFADAGNSHVGVIKNSGASGNGQLEFLTGSTPTERMRIDSSGRVLIRTTSSYASSNADDLQVGDNTDSAQSGITLGSTVLSSLRFADAGSDSAGVISYLHSDDSMRFLTAGSERLRIDSSGNVGIGTTSPNAYSNYSTLTINGTTSGEIDIEANGTLVGQLYGASGVFSLDARGESRDLRFRTNTVERMRIDSSGYVGIGTSSPVSILDVTVGGAGARKFLANYDNSVITIKGANASSNPESFRLIGDNIRFNTGTSGSGTERMRIDSSGRLLVGAASAIGTGNSQYALIQTFGNTAGANGDARVVIGRGQASTAMNNNTNIGQINFTDNAGGEFAQIQAVADAVPGANDFPGRLVFKTCADGSSNLAERMRINSSGQVGIGTTSPTKKLHVNGEAFFTGNTFFLSTNTSAVLAGTATGKYIQSDGNLISGKTTTSSTSHQAFCNPNGIVGTIQTSGSSTAYNTSSDYRLKENVVDIADGITRVKQLQPRRFNFIADADTIVDGFIAHEAQTVVPEAVSGTHNEVDDDGKAVMQGIDQSKLVPLLTAALKEAIAKIETLETRVAALEAG